MTAPNYDNVVRSLDFEGLRKLGTQTLTRSGDYTYDYDQNMNRVQRYYFGTFPKGKLAQAVRDRLHQLDYTSVTIFDSRDKAIHHIYASKDD